MSKRASHRTLAILSLLAPGLLLGCAEEENLPTGLPVSSSPIAVSATGSTVWVVNPDSDTVGRIDTASGRLVEEIQVGDNPRTLTIHPLPGSGAVYVANQNSDSVSRIDADRDDAKHHRGRGRRHGGRDRTGRHGDRDDADSDRDDALNRIAVPFCGSSISPSGVPSSWKIFTLEAASSR